MVGVPLLCACCRTASWIGCPMPRVRKNRVSRGVAKSARNIAAAAPASTPTTASANRDRDRAARTVDVDDGAVGEPARGVFDADNGGDPELAGNDRGVAEIGADLADDRAGDEEQRRPRRIGDRRD